MLGGMTELRVLWKFSAFVFWVIIFLICSFTIRLCYKSLSERRRFYVKLVSFLCRQGRSIFKINVEWVNAPPKDKSYLFIGNHLGMLDILVLASERPALFITSVDMRETPIIGTLTEIAGCLFVERRNRSNITNEILEIREALNQGFSVTLYPEGTSTDGAQVLPFKKTLMTSAAGTGVPLMPAIINYTHINGEPMSHKWRDYVCWYGDQSFLSSLLKIFACKSIDVRFEFGEEIMVHTEEERRTVAAIVQKAVESKFVPIPYPEGVEPSWNRAPPIKT